MRRLFFCLLNKSKYRFKQFEPIACFLDVIYLTAKASPWDSIRLKKLSNLPGLKPIPFVYGNNVMASLSLTEQTPIFVFTMMSS